jgi:hypothetical protein
VYLNKNRHMRKLFNASRLRACRIRKAAAAAVGLLL